MSPEKRPSCSKARARRKEIARLNDAFRRSGRDLYITPAVQDLPDVPGLIRAVQTFNTFTKAIDPHGEHDFGAINWHKEKTYWKIDYYDQNLEYGVDPLFLDCRRTLTMLLASEY